MKSRLRTNPSSILVFANLASGGVLEPGMSGGDRIAIECLRRWSDAFRRTFVVTTRAGKAMYVRNSLPRVEYLASTKIVLPKHSLFNNVALQVLTTAKSILIICRMLRHLRLDRTILYSTSDFPGDFLPGLFARILGPKCIWVASFFLFAPSPFMAKNPYRGLRALRASLWHLAQAPILALTRRFADLVFVTNESDKHRFIGRKNSIEGRVVVVRGGVDLSLSRDVSEPPIKTYDAVFIGRLHPQKGVLELVEIWRLVCNLVPGAQLAIIGNGELEQVLRRRISDYGMNGNVHMFGFVDGREKITIFRQSRVVLHPVVYDSGGMAPAEAMACGLPGICFDLPVLRTYYPRGMIRVPAYDIKMFAETIAHLLRDSRLYSRLSLEALEESKGWDWNKKAEDLLRRVETALEVPRK